MRKVELVMVTTVNNNKYYRMEENSDGTFTVKYGRVGTTENTRTYPISKWNAKYKEKIRKGYKDITELKVVSESSTFKSISDSQINTLLNQLQRFSSKSIKDNYTVTSEAVTQAQIDEAQSILDKIARLVSKRTINNHEIDKLLTELYTVIPRRMKKVQDFILNDHGDIAKAKRILEREQDSIDTMQGQVALNDVEDKEDKTILEALGIEVEVEKDNKTIDEIKKMMNDDADQLKRVYRVVKKDTAKKFEKQQTKSIKKWTRLLWHGSRNENWLNILKTGLLIRPSCAVQTGAMFGNGIYFANKFQKSRGYSSLSGSYWAGGNSKKAFLALYEVNTGMEYRVNKHTSAMYTYNFKKLRNQGDFDSLYAIRGYDLRNDEFIIYKEDQCTIKYLIEIEK